MSKHEKEWYITDKNGNIQKVSICVSSNIDGYEIDESSDEVIIIKNIINHMGLDFNSGFSLSKTAEYYTTLKYREHDIMRLHSDNLSSWVKLPIFNKDKYVDDPRFTNFENKTQLFWQTPITNIYAFEDILTDAIEDILKGGLEPIHYEPNDDEKAIVGVIMNYMNIDDYELKKNNKETSSLYINNFPNQLFDIKCTKRSKWLRIYDTGEKIELNDFCEDKLPIIEKTLNKIIKKRASN